MTDAESATKTPPTGPWKGELPVVESGMGPDEVLGALERMSRRGKLAGFARRGDSGFSADAFGTIYDRTLVGEVEAVGEGARIRFEAELKRKTPTIVLVVFALSLWPGVWLMHSLLTTYFPSWYPRAEWVTWAWYVPMTLLAVPVLLKQFRASEAASWGHAHEVVEKIARGVRG